MIHKRLKERLDRCFADGVEKGLWAVESAGTYTVEACGNIDGERSGARAGVSTGGIPVVNIYTSKLPCP